MVDFFCDKVFPRDKVFLVTKPHGNRWSEVFETEQFSAYFLSRYSSILNLPANFLLENGQETRSPSVTYIYFDDFVHVSGT